MRFDAVTSVAHVKLGVARVFAFVVVLVALVAATAWFVSHEVTVGWASGSVVAGILLTAAAQRYRLWLKDVTGPWEAREEIGTAVGLLFIAYGASLLETASEWSSSALATFGVALALLGLIPVGLAIRKDLEAPSRLQVSTRPAGHSLKAWSANLAVVTLAVVPALVMVGVTWWLSLGVVALWLASEATRRLIALEGAWKVLRWVALACLVAPISFVVLFTNSSWTSVKVLYPVAASVLMFFGAVKLVSTQVVLERFATAPVRWLRNRNVAALVALAASVALIFGVVVLNNRLAGVQGYLKIGIIITFIVLGVTFVIRGDGFVIAALLGALTVWTLADRTEPDTPKVDKLEHKDSPLMVVLGDSYASGEGGNSFLPGTNVAGGNECRRTNSAYPVLVAHDLGLHPLFFSCSGAVASELYATGQVNRGAEGDPVGMLPQLDNFAATYDGDDAPKLVVLSIGGNDSFFGLVGQACVLPGSCAGLDGVLSTNLGFVEAGIATALGRVANTFPSSLIVVVPYPEMLYPNSEGCGEVPLDRREYGGLVRFVSSLNNTVKAAVGVAVAGGASKVEFFDGGRNAYVGHQMCDPNREGELVLNALRLAPTNGVSLAARLNPRRWLHNTFHPRREGHELMAKALLAWLSDVHPTLVPDTVRADAQDPPSAASVEPPAPAPQDAEVYSPPEERPAAGVAPCSVGTCRAKVTDWIEAAAVDAFRTLLWPALLLFSASWLLFVALKALRVGFLLANPKA